MLGSTTKTSFPYSCFIRICEGKAIPLQALTDPKLYKKVSSQILRQSAHGGGKVVSPTHRSPLPPGNILGTYFC
jgi:hypothetical protein